MKSVYSTYDRQGNPQGGLYKFCPLCGTPLTLRIIEQKQRPTCPACGFVQFKNPAPAVSILIPEGDKVLLGRRSGQPGKGRWALPSGYVEFDEDFITAAVREAREETGLIVEIESVLHVESSFLSPQYHFLGVYLLASVTGGELVSGDDLAEVKWFSMSGTLPDMAFQSDRDLIGSQAASRFAGLPVE